MIDYEALWLAVNEALEPYRESSLQGWPFYFEIKMAPDGTGRLDWYNGQNEGYTEFFNDPLPTPEE